MDVDVVVIGSGAGGLATAVALARAGKRVVVLEQHTLPGGWCHSFDLEGFRFSPGVHDLGELGPGGKLREVFEGLGLELAFYELDPDGYDQIRVGAGPGGFAFDMPRGREALTERLCAAFPGDAPAIRTFVGRMAAIARELQAASTATGLARLALPLRAPNLLRYGLGPLERLLRDVRDPVARTVLTAQSGDYGLPPSRAPALLHAAVMGHYFEGAWYPHGGGRALPKAMIKALRAHGGQIKVGARVASIDLEGRKVRGVRLADGTEIRAGTVVSNADPHATVALLGDAAPRRWRMRLPRTDYSVSALSLFLAAKMDARAHGLTSGNRWILRGPDPEEMYRYAEDPNPLQRGPVPGAFLTCTTCKDPSERDDGIATFEAFTLVSWGAFRAWADSAQGERPRAYQELKDALADRVLALLEEEVPGLTASLVFRDVGSPLTNAHYVAATHGSMYGTAKHLAQLGPFGWGPGTPIDGLWMCGASTLAHGVGTAVFSGLAAASAITGARASELLGGGGAVRLLPAEPALAA